MHPHPRAVIMVLWMGMAIALLLSASYLAPSRVVMDGRGRRHVHDTRSRYERAEQLMRSALGKVRCICCTPLLFWRY